MALVTGGAIRVGRAIALGLAKAGYNVAFSYCSSKAAAGATRARLKSLGVASLAIRADLSEPDASARVVDAVAAEFGRLDLLVNSAASFRAANLLDVTCEEWDDVMALNLRAPFLVVRCAAPLLRASRGNVVNIVDLSAIQAWTNYPHHSVSKAGLLHLTKVMARVLAPEVRVNAVAPGHVLGRSVEGVVGSATNRDVFGLVADAVVDVATVKASEMIRNIELYEVAGIAVEHTHDLFYPKAAKGAVKAATNALGDALTIVPYAFRAACNVVRLVADAAAGASANATTATVAAVVAAEAFVDLATTTVADAEDASAGEVHRSDVRPAHGGAWTGRLPGWDQDIWSILDFLFDLTDDECELCEEAENEGIDNIVDLLNYLVEADSGVEVVAKAAVTGVAKAVAEVAAEAVRPVVDAAYSAAAQAIAQSAAEVAADALQYNFNWNDAQHHHDDVHELLDDRATGEAAKAAYNAASQVGIDIVADIAGKAIDAAAGTAAQIASQFGADVAPSRDRPQSRLRGGRTLLRRDGQPEDVVQAVLFLCRAQFVTGEVLVCDGGQLVRT